MSTRFDSMMDSLREDAKKAFTQGREQSSATSSRSANPVIFSGQESASSSSSANRGGVWGFTWGETGSPGSKNSFRPRY